ncbi:probable ATP-dependent RNA helicase DDX60 [Eublepharis macularius]|uniref:Probable ATP-dependent RNA helicase DDX60 n=1 Tax=Eublepharis macularius TaxID=481883 RepID=A0AA97JUK0_EUBMA|nr:probable ATP-dependent RNA helicase DDX60 [Eublepharis macularius]
MVVLPMTQYSSILNDFVESEFFVIDGDSLLVRCMCTQGPFLSFIYTVECFLNDFIQKGARFIIVFFKDVEQMYFSQPYLLFLRTMLIQHLDRNTDLILHTEFSNCLSPEWQIFLKESYPYFMVISDMGLTSIQTDYLNIFLSHTLSKKINVVLALGEESDILRIHAYHVQSMYGHKVFFTVYEKDILRAWETMLKHLTEFKDAELFLYKHLKFNVRMMQEEVCQAISLLKDLWPEGSDIRCAFCVLTCAVGLKIYKSMLEKAKVTDEIKREPLEQWNEKDTGEGLTMDEVADLCRIQCLSVAFLCSLPLSQRAQIRIIKSCWTVQVFPFIKMLQRCDYLVLKYLNVANDWKLDFTYLADLRDNFLWKNLVCYYELEYCAGLKLELGKDIQNCYQYLWNTATTIAGLCDLGEAFPVRNTPKLFLQQTEITDKECTDVPSFGLIPIKSDIVEDYAGTILEDLSFLSRYIYFHFEYWYL